MSLILGHQRPDLREFPDLMPQRSGSRPESGIRSLTCLQCDRRWAGLAPGHTVAEHRPADHQEPSGRGDHGDFPASFVPATDSLADLAGFSVAAPSQPSDLDQQGSKSFVAPAADPALPVHRPGIELRRSQTRIGSHLLGVLESFGIVEDGGAIASYSDPLRWSKSS